MKRITGLTHQILGGIKEDNVWEVLGLVPGLQNTLGRRQRYLGLCCQTGAELLVPLDLVPVVESRSVVIGNQQLSSPSLPSGMEMLIPHPHPPGWGRTRGNADPERVAAVRARGWCGEPAGGPRRSRLRGCPGESPRRSPGRQGRGPPLGRPLAAVRNHLPGSGPVSCRRDSGAPGGRRGSRPGGARPLGAPAPVPAAVHSR